MIRLAFSLALAACLVSVPARADPPAAAPISTARLEYTRATGAERCPGEQELRDAVGTALGRDPFTLHAPHRLTVRLGGGVGSELFGDVYLIDGTGTARGRRIHEPSGECSRLIDRITLMVSVALSPVPRPPAQADRQPRVTELRAPAVAPWPPRSNAPATPTPTAPLATPPPSIASPWGFEISAGGGLAGNIAPNLAGGLVAGAAVRRDWWSVGLETRGYFPASTEETAGASAAVSLITGAVVPCGKTPLDPVPVYGFGCVVVAAGAVLTEGNGVDLPREESGFYMALGLRAGFEIPLLGRRLALRVHGDAALQPVLWDVRLAGEVVWMTPRVAVGAGGELVTFF